MIDVSVAICTWNRAGLLDKTLERLAGVRVPAGLTWEVVVVDNNSADGTAAVLARHAGRLPLVPLTETKQGHSHARNRALAVARGALILWTDDDVLTDPEWLSRMTSAAAAHPDADFFGGPVRPWFESPPPAWLADNLGVLGICFALVDYGPTSRRLAPTERVVGANVAFRKSAMDRFPFDPEYGRVGAKLTSGDDTRVQEQVVAAGGHGVWVGDAAVDHFLPTARVTTAYIRGIFYWGGYQARAAFDAPAATLRGVPRWILQAWLRAAVARRLGNFRRGPAWARALRDEAKFAGLIRRFRDDRRAS